MCVHLHARASACGVGEGAEVTPAARAGEEDRSMARGRPLYLSAARLELVTRIVTNVEWNINARVMRLLR